MTEQEQKRLGQAKRQYFLKINDTPVAILVDDDDKTIVAGCFETLLIGNPEISEKEMTVPISLKSIQDKTVLAYAHFMLKGIIEKIKSEKKI